MYIYIYIYMGADPRKGSRGFLPAPAVAHMAARLVLCRRLSLLKLGANSAPTCRSLRLASGVRRDCMHSPRPCGFGWAPIFGT